jgi:protein import protein ZIM17
LRSVLRACSTVSAQVLTDFVAPSAGQATQIPGATLTQTEKMVIMYTCRVCDTRSARIISKVCTYAFLGTHSRTMLGRGLVSEARLPSPPSHPTLDSFTLLQPAYHEGVVLVRCPGCQKLHLVADRLGYFEDDSADVESLLAAKGERVRRGAVGPGAVQLRMADGQAAASASSISPLATVAPLVGSSQSTAPGALGSEPASRSPSPAVATPALGADSTKDGPSDPFVLEFTEEDIAVLSSSTKSINLKTRTEVVQVVRREAVPTPAEDSRPSAEAHATTADKSAPGGDLR